jgi:hypothetical protein
MYMKIKKYILYIQNKKKYVDRHFGFIFFPV